MVQPPAFIFLYKQMVTSMQTHNILVAEDDPSFAKQLIETLEGEGHHVTWAPDGKKAISLIKEQPTDLALLDIEMPGINGMQVLEFGVEHYPLLPMVIITGHASIERAVKATQIGAYDFIEKPISLDRLLITVEHALEKRDLELKNQWFSQDILERYKMVGSSIPMQHIYNQIDKVAPINCTVFIKGETGTGKEFAARALHMQSNRASGPFIKINCAAIPETLLESELFGYKKGAFTGAVRDKEGKIVQADGGTLFLDEIGDMSYASQAKILRAIQEQEVEALGDTTVRQVDVRFISASNKNIKELIKDNQFRDDLFYRLADVEITMPPLRDRREDIPDLAYHFSEAFSQQNNRQFDGFNPDALQCMMQHDWPGNVRELQAAINRVLIFSNNKEITGKDICGILSGEYAESDNRPIRFREAMNAFEKEFLMDSLTAHNWNIGNTANSLGIDRTNLHKKMKKWGINKH